MGEGEVIEVLLAIGIAVALVAGLASVCGLIAVLLGDINDYIEK